MEDSESEGRAGRECKYIKTIYIFGVCVCVRARSRACVCVTGVPAQGIIRFKRYVIGNSFVIIADLDY